MRPRGRGAGHTLRELSVGKTGAVCPAPACGAGSGCPRLPRSRALLVCSRPDGGSRRHSQTTKAAIPTLRVGVARGPVAARPAETCPRVRGKLKSSLTNKLQIRLTGVWSGGGARKETAQKHVTKTSSTGTKLSTIGWFLDAFLKQKLR